MAPNNPQTSRDILQQRGNSTLGESSVNPLHICRFGALPPLAAARQLYDLKEIPSWHPSIFRKQVKHRLERKEGIHSNSPSELWGDFCAYCTLFKCFRIFVWTEKPFKSAFCWFPFDFLPNTQQKYLPTGNCKQDLEFPPFWVELTCSKGLNGLPTQSASLKVDHENQTTDVWFLSSKLIFPTAEGILSLAQH